MKKTLFYMLFTLFMCVTLLFLSSCDSENEHIGEAKTPSSSSAMKGQDFENVEKTFIEHGFTNIRLEAIGDLITGWITKDGEVDRVTVGGDEQYVPDKWLPEDTEVIIYYHTFAEKVEENDINTVDGTNTSSTEIVIPFGSQDYINDGWTIDDLTNHLKELGFTNVESKEYIGSSFLIEDEVFSVQIGGWSKEDLISGNTYPSESPVEIKYYSKTPTLTSENCPDLKEALTSTVSYTTFAKEYDGEYIEFDGCVRSVSRIELYGNIEKTIIVTGGDNTVDEATVQRFFVDFDNYETRESKNVDRSIEEGDNIKIIAKVNNYDSEYHNMIVIFPVFLEIR